MDYSLLIGIEDLRQNIEYPVPEGELFINYISNTTSVSKPF